MVIFLPDWREEIIMGENYYFFCCLTFADEAFFGSSTSSSRFTGRALNRFFFQSSFSSRSPNMLYTKRSILFLDCGPTLVNMIW